jgi:hypothetical protein
MDANQIEFEVKGIGKFTALKEVVAPMFFLDRRKMIADMFGGMSEYIKMQTLIRIGNNSEDRLQKELADTLINELIRAEWIINIKTEVIKYPDGFNFQALKAEQLNELIDKFQEARGIFRSDTKPTGETSPPPKD